MNAFTFPGSTASRCSRVAEKVRGGGESGWLAHGLRIGSRLAGPRVGGTRSARPPPPFQQPELLVIHDEENAAQYARVQPARNIPIGFPIVIP